jgi:hypothetical protein
MMRILPLAAAALFAAGAAHAAGLVEIAPDAKGGPMVGNAGGTPVTRPYTAFGFPTFDPDPPSPPPAAQPQPPPKAKAPSAKAP